MPDRQVKSTLSHLYIYVLSHIWLKYCSLWGTYYFTVICKQDNFCPSCLIVFNMTKRICTIITVILFKVFTKWKDIKINLDQLNMSRTRTRLMTIIQSAGNDPMEEAYYSTLKRTMLAEKTYHSLCVGMLHTASTQHKTENIYQLLEKYLKL